MHLYVIGPAGWQPFLKRTTEDLRPEITAQARALLRHAHNRHVGLAADTAIALVHLLEQGRSAARGPGRSTAWPWDLVMERAVKSLAGDFTPGLGRRKGLLLRSVPSYAVLWLALPLVELACEKLGESYLFGDDGQEVPTDFNHRYRTYQADLGQAIADLASEDDLEIFFAEWALMAQGLSRRNIERLTRNSLPDPDSLVHALIERMEPVLERDHLHRESYVPRVIRRAEDRRGIRPKEGGVVGINVSRRLQDLPDVLYNQFALPEEMLLDKLANTGFLVRHRPPPLDKKRDLLFFGAMPKGWDEALAPLAKASWFDAALRVGILLRKAGLERSDFVWIEGDPLGGLKSSAVPLELAPFSKDAQSVDVTPILRRNFLGALDWLPGFLDSRSEFHDDLPALCETKSVLLDIDYRKPEDDPRIPIRWLPRALKRVLNNYWPTRSEKRSSNELGLSFDSYALVFGTILLPALTQANKREPLVQGLGLLRYSLGLEVGGPRCLSPVWLPETLANFSGWPYLDRYGNEILTLPPVDTGFGHDGAHSGKQMEPGLERMNAIAGALIGHWLSGVESVVFGD